MHSGHRRQCFGGPLREIGDVLTEYSTVMACQVGIQVVQDQPPFLVMMETDKH
jgi:uncharacterized protein (DUF934 family)